MPRWRQESRNAESIHLLTRGCCTFFRSRQLGCSETLNESDPLTNLKFFLFLLLFINDRRNK